MDITSDKVKLDSLVDELQSYPNAAQLESILDTGAHPGEYLAEYESKLRVAEVQAIEEYVRESDCLLELHEKIEVCNSVLESLESILRGYEESLGTVTNEISTLLQKSEHMQSKVENRKKVSREIGGYVERMVLTPFLIETIMTAPVNGEEFKKALEQLHDKLEYVEKNDHVRISAAFRDVAVQMEKIRIAAIKRCRVFLVDKMLEMKIPKSNLQVQQNVLLKYRGMMAFLRDHGEGIYSSIQLTYITTVSLRLLEIFKSYWARIEQVEKIVIQENILIGSPASGSQTLNSMMHLLNLGTTIAEDNPSDEYEIFKLHDRIGLLEHIDEGPLYPDDTTAKFPFEVIFMSLSKLMVDLASHEYLFCSSFWMQDRNSIFRETFRPILEFVHGSLQTALLQLSDPIALLLCIKINREHFLVMSRRRNPALDDHFDSINLMLWPRVKSILDAHLDSIQNLQDTAVEIMAGFPTNKVLVATKRYAALTGSIIILNATLVDGSLSLNIERLRYAFINFLLTASRAFPKKGSGTIFLLHNIDYIVSDLRAAFLRYSIGEWRITISEGSDFSASKSGKGMDAPCNQIATELLASFEEAFSRALDLYVDSKISQNLLYITSFIRQEELAAAREDRSPRDPQISLAKATKLANDFSGSWESHLTSIQKHLDEDFSGDFLRELVQKTLYSKFLSTWSRLLEILKGYGGQDVAQQSISVASIMYAMNKG